MKPMVSKFVKNLRKQSVKIHERVDAAYHESGHTIYGLLKLMKIVSVSITHNVKKQGGEGLTIYENVFDFDEVKDCDPELLDYCVQSEIGLSYAGLCAERILYKNIADSDICYRFLKDGASEDTESASELIVKYNLAPAGKKRYKLKQKMINETADVLVKYWDDVVIVSHALFKRKRLYYSDLKSLLIKSSPNKSFWREQFRSIDFIGNNRGVLDIKKLKSIVLA